MKNQNPYQHAADDLVGDQFRQIDEDHREPRFVVASLIAILLCISTIIVSGILTVSGFLAVATLRDWLLLIACFPYYVMTIGFIRRARLTSPSRTTSWVWTTSIVLHSILFGLTLFAFSSDWVADRSFLLVILIWTVLSVVVSILGSRLDQAILRERANS